MMKRILLYGLVVLVFFVATSAYSLDYLTIRPYGEFGSTLANADISRSEKFNYGFGVQILVGDSDEDMFINIGLDMGYSSLYNVYFSDPSRAINYFRSQLILECAIKGFFVWPTFQIGLGANWDLEHISGNKLVITLAAGFTIPITDSITIPILLKSEVLYFIENPIGTFSVLAGVSITLDL